MASVQLATGSESQTLEVGARLARMIPAGCCLALDGPLGAGKTVLVRGMTNVLAPGAAVSSPTFTLINEYGSGPRVYHIDLYRLTELRQAHDLGIEDILAEPDSICIIEWAGRMGNLLPEKRVSVTLEHRGGDNRTIKVVDCGVLPENWDEKLQATRADR